jgi:site-specific recombinase XerD
LPTSPRTHQGYEVHDTEWLFTSKARTPLSRNNFRTKFWAPAVKDAKIEQKVTFHSLRAAHASWLLAGGADIIVVQDRLGHRQITTTPVHRDAARFR